MFSITIMSYNNTLLTSQFIPIRLPTSDGLKTQNYDMKAFIN